MVENRPTALRMRAQLEKADRKLYSSPPPKKTKLAAYGTKHLRGKASFQFPWLSTWAEIVVTDDDNKCVFVWIPKLDGNMEQLVRGQPSFTCKTSSACSENMFVCEFNRMEMGKIHSFHTILSMFKELIIGNISAVCVKNWFKHSYKHASNSNTNS